MSTEDNEELDSQNQATEEVVKTEQVEDTALAETEDVEKLREQNKRLFERAKKAEAKLKEKPLDSQPINSASTETADPVEIANLANALQGLTQEEIDFAKTIAAGSKTTLLKALQSDGFQAYHSKIVAEDRKKKAALGGSKGSEQQVQKSLSETTREEHMRIAGEAAQNIQ